MVESESLFDEDRPKIAGVFINRLEAGMPLQSDITVLYALQEKKVDVTYADLEVDSPYNGIQGTLGFRSDRYLPCHPAEWTTPSIMKDQIICISLQRGRYSYIFQNL